MGIFLVSSGSEAYEIGLCSCLSPPLALDVLGEF